MRKVIHADNVTVTGASNVRAVTIGNRLRENCLLEIEGAACIS
jgi:hypothetical protein